MRVVAAILFEMRRLIGEIAVDPLSYELETGRRSPANIPTPIR